MNLLTSTCFENAFFLMFVRFRSQMSCFHFVGYRDAKLLPQMGWVLVTTNR